MTRRPLLNLGDIEFSGRDIEFSGRCLCGSEAYKRVYHTLGGKLTAPIRRCRTCRRGTAHCSCPGGPLDPYGVGMVRR